MTTSAKMFPYQIGKGDFVQIGENKNGSPKFSSTPVKRDPVVNPRGCKGKTHIDGGCYDNIVSLYVKRT